MKDGWVGVDLDGTLAIYPHSFPEIGPPVPAMVERVKGWLAEGADVRIFTARVGVVQGLYNDEGQEADTTFADDQRVKIAAWCEEHLGKVLPITATKDFRMVELWDDRCVQVIPNTGIAVQDLVGVIPESV